MLQQVGVHREGSRALDGRYDTAGDQVGPLKVAKQRAVEGDANDGDESVEIERALKELVVDCKVCSHGDLQLPELTHPSV